MVDTSLNIMVKLRLDEAKKDLNALRNAFNTLAQSDMGADTKKYQMLRKNLQIEQQMLSELGANHEVYKQTVATSKELGASLNVNAEQMNNIRHATKGFNMDFLTLIFAGMWLKQTFGGFFNMIINDYKRVMGMNSMFTKGVLKLQASFGYLKFAIGNALNSPGIVKMIEKISNAIVWLGDWISEHPGFATTLLVIAGALGAIGSFAMVAGGVEQAIMLFNLLGLSSSATAIGNLEKLKEIGIITAGLYFIWKGGKDLLQGDFSIENMLETAFGSALLGYQFYSKLGFGTRIGGAFAIGTATLALLYVFKLIADSEGKIKATLETEKPGFMRALSLLWDWAKGAFKSAIAGALGGAAIGSAVPGVGTALGAGVGALLGIITFSIGYIFKLLKVGKPELDEIKKSMITDEEKKKLAGSLAGTTLEGYVDTSWKPNLDAYNKLNETQYKLIGNFDLFNESISIAKEKTAALYNVNTNNVAKYDLFNTAINTSNEILPISTDTISKHIDKLNSEADAANRAASAQERLNRARSNSSSSSLLSSSISTTTKASSIFRR